METEIVKTKNPENRYSIGNTFADVKNMVAGTDRSERSQMAKQIASALTKTALNRLPPPFNFIAPMVAEKVIVKYGVEEGRELLLKGLYWVKKVTEDKPDETVQ